MHAQNAGKMITEGRKRDRVGHGVDGDAAPGTKLLAEGRDRCRGGGNKSCQKRRAHEDTFDHVISLCFQETRVCSYFNYITTLIGI